MKQQPADKLTKREQRLLEWFREIQSRHTQNAILVLASSAAWGNLTALADKKPLERIISE